MKRYLSLIVTIAMLLSLVSTGLFSITASAATSGTTGDCTWSLNGTVLTISGYGRMADYTYSSRAPWANNKITKVVIRDGVTNIGDYAFYYQTYLTTISIPDSVTSIGDSAFMNCSSLTGVDFPNGLTYIGSAAFSNDGGITSAVLPDSLTYIGSSAFAFNSIESVVIPQKVTAIADGTFRGNSLASVTLHNGIVSIGEGAFSQNNFSQIIIPDSVVSIGVGAFAGNESLSAVTIGANVKTISMNAFGGCSNLTYVYYRGSQTEKSNILIYSYNNTDLTNAYWNYNSCLGKAYHTYTNVCDGECNVCAFTRESPHKYTNNCDKDCNLCGFMRVPSEHTYDNTCDRVCNECGEERIITHTYSNDLDESCDICGRVRGPHTITYHLDGGTNALKNPDVYTEEDTITLADASKVGYDFVGWFLDANKTEQITEICMRGNVEIYAKFTPRSFSARFNDGVTLTLRAAGYEDYILYLNYGETIDPYSSEIMSKYLTEEKNSTFSLDPNFSGWFYDSSYTDKVSASIDLTTSTTLYCHFHNTDSKSATEMFKGSNSVTYYNSDVTKMYRVPTLSNGTLTISFSIDCYSSDWNEHYAASFTIYNETTQKQLFYKYWPSSQVYSRGGGVVVSVNPGDVIRCYNGSQGYDTDRTYARVDFTTERASCTVTSAKSANETICYDQNISPPTPASKNGYSFLGWYDLSGNEITDTWKYTEDQTFIPKWQLRNYYINYNLNGGTNSPSNPVLYTIEDTITLKKPTKVGHTFKGWYSDANFKTKVTSIAKKTGNITLYAKWEVNNYNLVLDANQGAFAPKLVFNSDGEELKRVYLFENDSINAYRPADKEGYVFAGWYEDEAFTSLFKFTGSLTDDTTLYAKWIKNDNSSIAIETIEKIDTTVRGKTEQLYAFVPLSDGKITVTSESNNLDLYGLLYDVDKKSLVSSDDISNTDLDFSYTYSVKAGQLYYIAVKGNTASTSGNARINITWVGDCKITGTTYQNREITVEYDTRYALPQKPIREGYVFLGWFDENDTKITDGIWNFVTDKSLTAKWEVAIPYTVIFKDAEGNTISSETYYVGDDIVAPELPLKSPDNTYTYSAKWGNGYTGICAGDAVYSPVYEPTYIDYTVRFVDEDGTEISNKTYHWEDEITVPTTPTKAADKTYTYTFAGWDKPVVNCAGDATYTATYTPTYIDYTVVFKNWDGTVLSSKTYHYGDKVTAPANPAKAADNTYTYTFSGWDKEVANCAGNATYTATYTSNYIDYTITFKNWNGDVLSTKTYHYGDKVTAPATPTREANNTYTYDFIGWDKTVSKVTGDAVYTATYAPVYISYTVIFQNYDGTVLSKQYCHYGDPISVPGNPIRYTDETYTYAFAGWDGEVTKCYGNKVYTATYKPAYRDYTITFINYDGSVISEKTYHYGDTVIPPENPTRASSNTYKYIFQGWNYKVTACTESKTYTAVYTAEYIDYTVTFKNYDGKVISSKVYHYGDEVVAPTPTGKPADSKYTYNFAGWDTPVVPCNGNKEYTATYTPSYINYTVVFQDWNGKTLSTKTYHYGDKVTAPTAPTRAADKTYTYTFAGWDKSVVNCAGDATYTATYTPTYINYTVTFKNWDGSVISSKTYHYGDKVTVPATPTRAADKTYTYSFSGWDKTVVNCAGDATYTAIFTSTYINYMVVFKNWDGSVVSSKSYHYGDKVTVPVSPTRAADKTYTYTFAGWDVDVNAVCGGNATYTATYKATYIDYTITFQYEDGTVIQRYTLHYGDQVTAPTSPAVPESLGAKYKFAGWDKTVTNCAGDAVYTAVFTRVGPVGDVDNNGNLTTDDAVYLLLHVMFGEEDYPVDDDISLDFNGSGKVSTDDAVYLLLHVMFGAEDYPLAV